MLPRTMTEHVSGSGGVKLGWDVSGDGPQVLLVHGIGSKRSRWDQQVEALSAAGFRVFRFDLRGFGDSELPTKPYGLAEFVADLDAVVDAFELDDFHLVGHSLGGMLSLSYAVAHPNRLRSLVVASATSHNGRRARAFAQAMVTFAERGFDAVMNDAEARSQIDGVLREAFPGIDPPVEMLRVGVEKPNLARAGTWRACLEYSTKDELERIACPVLVMHGSADPLIPFRAGQMIHESILHSEWIEESGAGHSLPRERTPSFNEALLDFLQRVEAGSAKRAG